MINLIIADDHRLFRSTLKYALEKSGKIFVVGEASNGVKLLELVDRVQSDLILLDIFMPIMDGIEVLPKLMRKKPKSKVVVLSMTGVEPYLTQMVSLGVLGYFTKNCEMAELITGIERIVSKQGLQPQFFRVYAI